MQSNFEMKTEVFYEAAEQSPPFRDGFGFQDNLQLAQLPRKWKIEIKEQLRRHIAENVKMGLYQLKPLVHKQCRFCRAINIAFFTEHEEWCQGVDYVFGCPCGYLGSSMRCFGGHSKSCEIAKYIKNRGDCGWFPYITYDFRQQLSEAMY